MPDQAGSSRRATIREAAAASAEIPPGNVLYGEWSEHWGREAAGIIVRTSGGSGQQPHG